MTQEDNEQTIAQDDKRPHWLTVANSFVLVATVIGSAIAFYANRPLVDAQKDNQIADTQLKAEQTSSVSAQRQLSKLDLQQRQQPRIGLRVATKQTASMDDVREITFELELTNKGSTDLDVRRIEVGVSEGKATERVRETISLVQQIAFFRHQGLIFPNATPVEPPYIVPREVSPEEQQVIDQLKEQHEEACPHGKLFNISATSPDIEWTELDNATFSRDAKLRLRADESVAQQLLFLLTEYPEQRHRQWFRFAIIVLFRDDSGRDISKTFEQYVSGLRLPQVHEFARTSSKEDIVVNVWQSAAPLIPVGPEELIEDVDPLQDP